ncbi:hypothetical protein CDD81_92 [Ophiocordyceps australis]|uniref:Cation/H+ exchanger transmembrane domain-containing protein n=1 Tax=Ophiocordyceps australis TaxID=1399860 RepID=A0A2C5XN74_9HYPO|nr:hypothetical protein CDD81_92 [Ophiocordyceps australis]
MAPLCSLCSLRPLRPLRPLVPLFALLCSVLADSPGPQHQVPSQAGVLEGANPTHYDPSNPIILFIIQVSLIVIVCHALHWPLSRLRQPRVIAEVVGGIVLGPSVMGRIAGFRQAIFPPESLPNLSVVANLGLVLYLFLIGLETDVRFLVRNWRVAASVALSGLALPFGAGCGLAWGVYQTFSDDAGVQKIRFSVYMLFIGIAVAITAFPVLCRILTELKLLDTPVGVITLSAGVANDVVGWVLLALCVALVNAGSGLTAVWILLCCLGYMLLLLLAVKPSLVWLLRRTRCIDNDPSQSAISLILLIALASAFFTGIIGVHPIFGGFMTGLIVPRDNRFNIRVTEKLEDLIGAIFLPLYFTLSGLNTNLGLLNSGKAWGYVFATTVVAIVTKIAGASLAARLNGLVWRESLTIGVLMSCKGLVELIVLNIGLEARILSTRTFTIFVVMALLTTFSTTPLVSLLYPPSYQARIEAWKRGELDWATGASLLPSDFEGPSRRRSGPQERIQRLLVYLRLDSMPVMLGLLSLFNPPHQPDITLSAEHTKTEQSVVVTAPPSPRAFWVHGVRLLHLTDRDSSVMTVSQAADYSRHDPVINTLRTVGRLNRLATSGEVAVVPDALFAEALSTRALRMSADLLLLPWTETGSLSDSPFLSAASVDDKMASSAYACFVRGLLDAPSRDLNLAIFVARSDDLVAEPSSSAGLGDTLSSQPPCTPSEPPYHIFLPYTASDDDRFALRLVLQMCAYSTATATVLRISASTPPASDSSALSASADPFFDAALAAAAHLPSHSVHFDSSPGLTTVEDILRHAHSPHSSLSPTLIVLGRNSGTHLDEGKITRPTRDHIAGCLGSLAAHFTSNLLHADVLVVQSKSQPDASSSS